MQFKITKKFDLSYLGEDWKGCYLEFSAPSVGSLTKSLEGIGDIDEKDTKLINENFTRTMALLKENFISGKALDVSGEVLEVSKNDLEQLPADIVTKLMDFLVSASTTKEQ